MEVLRELFELGLRSFLEKTDSKLKKLEPLFASHSVRISPTLPDTDGRPATVLSRLIQRPDQDSNYLIQYPFAGYKGQASAPFSINSSIRIRFREFQFTIESNNKELTKRLYSNPVLSDDAEAMATAILADAFAEIKKQSGLQK